MSLTSSIKNRLGVIEEEDEEWKSEFPFLARDEHEAEKLKQEFMRLPEYNIQENPEQFCIELLDFIEGDFTEFLENEWKELNQMKNSPKKVRKRATDIVELIGILEQLVKEVEEIETQQGDFNKDTRIKRKKLQMKLEKEDSQLRKYEQKFHERGNKAKYA